MPVDWRRHVLNTGHLGVRGFQEATDEPGLAVGFAAVDRSDLGKGEGQRTGPNAKWSGFCVYFGQGGDRQHRAGRKSLDDWSIEVGVTEEVAQHQICGRAIRKAVVEVVDDEVGAVSDPAIGRELGRRRDRDRGNVDAHYVHSSLSQPDRAAAASTCDLEGVPRCWEQPGESGERVGWTWL